MSAAEFDAYTRGKTFYYEGSGAPYGAEEYLDNNRVRWSFLDGKCIEGVWYMQGEMICFEYENDLGPECWVFSLSENGLTARFSNPANSSDPTVLYEVEQSDKPLLCLGPEVGV